MGGEGEGEEIGEEENLIILCFFCSFSFSFSSFSGEWGE